MMLTMVSAIELNRSECLETIMILTMITAIEINQSEYLLDNHDVNHDNCYRDEPIRMPGVSHDILPMIIATEIK